MKKTMAFVMALLLACGVMTAAMARTVEPEESETERLAGKTVNATVGEYVDYLKAFRVTVYERDRFDEDDVERLAAGDILLADGQPHTVKEMSNTPYGDTMAVTEDGLEIVFEKDRDDDYTAHFTDDDRQCMHAIAVLLLKPAEGMVYEDNSERDLDAEMKVTDNLEEILKIKAEKEENSIGFDFYATTVTLNEKLEIVKIHQDFDVAQ